jgi:hypothetical protein
MTCILNPTTGREELFNENTITDASDPGHWVVIGGGAAGLKAADTLLRRGHRVTLLEKDQQLGGQINLIIKTKRPSFAKISKDLERSINKRSGEIRTGVAATRDMVVGLAPDGVIVATGARPDTSGFNIVNPSVDRLPGVDQSNVISGWQAIEDPDSVGQSVLILDDDGTRYVAGLAEMLLDKGRSVRIVSRQQGLFNRMNTTLDLPVMLKRLLSAGLEFTPNSWASGIDGSQAELFNIYSGEVSVLGDVDTFILTTGHLPVDALYFELKDALENVHRVGDAVAPRRIEHAIYEGFLAGLEQFDNWSKYIEPGDLEQYPSQNA